MRYQRLTTLGVAALGAAASVSASPLFQRAQAQCPPGYTMSVYYITVTAEATSSATPLVKPTTTISSSSTTTLTATVTSQAPSQSTSPVVVDSTSAAATVPTVAETTPVETHEAVVVPAASSSSSSTTSTLPTSSSTQEQVIVPTANAVVAVSSATKAEPTTSALPTSSSTEEQVIVSTANAVVAVSSATKAEPTTAAPSTTTAAASSSSSSSSGSSNSGKATFYGGNVSGGTCSFAGYTLPSGLFGTALSAARWDDAAQCGACVSVTGPNGNSIKAMIVDQCPECESNHLDLFQNAFAELADISKGVIDITWSYVSCDIDSPLVLKNKEGTSAYWFSMQVVNANEPVEKLEVSTDGGSTWQATTRTYYNFFENSSGFGTDTVDVRVTGQSGATLTVKNVGCSSGSSVTASSNL
ncbi:putative extracellular cellulase CelA/allergen Asp F7-like [Aspergillus thermomutatus]|uniref:Expansin-like EG45 domain-containing protein n=1 Tax=Aspergillus thermomutatus TaxID=41047 RepID=A0A397GGS6_ASPTH|nr:uncharacterized protein CDV56_102402 [Aspergillus thermomutatus]RHZ48606.1 hypothetical protein CDV56_102402 [Aspergillus thermomutatus]